MATYFNDLSLASVLGDTIRPQSITGNTNGVAVDLAPFGGNVVNAILSVGAVSSLTSLDVKIQVSPDGSGSWADVTGAAFTQVTAANNLQIISFQVPRAPTTTAAAYRYARAVCTIVGTSALTHVVLIGLEKMPNPNSGYVTAPPTIN